MKDLIKTLSDMRGISGFEYRIADKIKAMFEPYADSVTIDALGSVIAVKKCGKENAPRLMIEAHCDEIGLMVTDVTDEGFLTIANVGGVDQRTLPSTEVVVHGRRDLWGVIGIKPPHMLEDGKTVKISDMTVDTGLDARTVKSLVTVGDSVSLAQSVGEMGVQMSGKSFDDRASVAAILTVMKNIENDDLNIDVYAVAAVQEEVGLRGGKTASYGIDPDMAIAIDVTHGITPDNSERAFEVGEGLTISVGPNIHPKMANRLFETAEKHNIKANAEVDGGETGTDAWVIQIARDGVPTALLSMPLKYMHTSVETLYISDVEDVARLITEFIRESEADTKWLSF